MITTVDLFMRILNRVFVFLFKRDLCVDQLFNHAIHATHTTLMRQMLVKPCLKCDSARLIFLDMSSMSSISYSGRHLIR